jgi:hypothetical protein
MLGIFPAPKAATGEGRKASRKRDTRISDMEIWEEFPIFSGMRLP